MKQTGSIYYNTDKNVHDALQNRKFGKKVLTDQLKDRGIFVSHQEEKEELVEYCSPIFTDYHNQKFIHEVLDDTKPRSNYQSTKIETTIEASEIREICQKIVEEREAIGESTKIHISPDSKIITIQSSYTEPDYSKSVMSQNLTRTSNIRIEKTEDGLKVRGYSDDKSLSMSKDLIGLIRDENADRTVDEIIISLEAITDSIARSEFFHRLISNINGYKIDDVKSVDVNHPKNSNSNEGDEEEEDIIGFIKKAVLNGGSVLNSPEFKSLNDSDFYVTKIKWSAVSEELNGDKVDFSAEFKSTDTCTDFNYSVISIYNKKKDGEYTKNGKSPSDIEKNTLLPLIEKSASEAHQFIIDKYGEKPDLDESNE